MRAHRRLARGRSEATPARLLTSVATVVLGIAAVVVAVGLAIYLLA